jgi:predicted ATPase
MTEESKGLCGLWLGNFKAFAETQQIPIRRLTLIYGANSAGKSSIIHSLLLANHALENGNVDVHQTKLGGAALDLGGFTQFVHQHDLKRQFELGLDLKHKNIESFVGCFGGFSHTAVRFQIGLPLAANKGQTTSATPQVQAVQLDLEGLELMRLERQPDGRLHSVSMNFEHRVLKAALDKLIEHGACRGFIYDGDEDMDKKQRAEANEKKARLRSELDGIKDAILTDLAKVPFSTDHFLPRGLVPEGEELDYSYIYDHDDPAARLDGFEEEDEHQLIARKLRFVIEQLFEAFREAFSKQLRRISYLGPLRCYPPRHFAGMHDQDPNWFSGGGQAWEVLRREPEVLRTVNRWLTAPERLAKGYELVVRRLADVQKIASELQGPLEDALGKLRSDPKASITEQADAVLKKWMASRNAAGILSEIILQDITSKTEVSHRDIGQGISQVLPVLVSAYALKEHIIAIEQPELHLHPALQAELGDVFIESALGERANKFLIESHSEYLLLRIMRRMKETHRGKLPAGLCQVRPDDVAVLYVEPVGTRSIVREMPLNEQGELVKDWPGGFFEEGLREVLM